MSIEIPAIRTAICMAILTIAFGSLARAESEVTLHSGVSLVRSNPKASDGTSRKDLFYVRDQLAVLLLKFDLSRFKNPVKSATLQLRAANIEKRGDDGEPARIKLAFFRMITPWSEEATWSQPQVEKKWTDGGFNPKPGNDFESSALGEIEVIKSPEKDYNISVSVTEAVNDWISNAENNQGIAVLVVWGKGYSVQANFDMRDFAPRLQIKE